MSDNEMDYDLVDRNLQFIFLHHKKKGDTGTANIIEQAGQSITNLRARVAELEHDISRHLAVISEIESERGDLRQARDAAWDRIEELEADRRTLQQAGRHPAPCARHCEAAAFSAEISLRDSRIGAMERQLSRSDSDLGLACRGAVERGREIETLEAENHRMRGALEQIAAGGRVDVRSLARAGLNSQGDGEHES